MNSKLKLIIILAFFTLWLMVTGCAPGDSEQGGSDTTDSAETADSSAADADHAEEADEQEHDHEDEHDHEAEAATLTLPALNAVALAGAPLRVVATTSIIGDVVAQVGGTAIDLTVLMGPGQDPHSYEPAAQDLTAVANADVIFVNGWDLEESLVDNLANIGEAALLVPISANIEPLLLGDGEHDEGAEHDEDEHHEHSGADPHVWFSVPNVEQWVENVAHVLSELDPTHADTYAANAQAYTAELAELEAYAQAELAAIPAERRFLVTNHDAFGYLAAAYDFTILGAVIPSVSSVAEPSAGDLADLITAMAAHNVCTVFTETTVNDTLAQTVASEVSGCDDVQILQLYTGAVGPAGSGAESYISMFRANVAAIVSGLNGN